MSYNGEGITLPSQFKLKSKQPIDSRFVITNATEFTQMKNEAWYPGLRFCVTSDITVDGASYSKGVYSVEPDGTSIVANNYLPLSGGTMTGPIICPASGDILKCSADGGLIIDRFGNIKPNSSAAQTWNVYKDSSSTKGFSVEWATANVSTTGKFIGNLEGNATTATKATQDGSGNVITDTYTTNSKLNNWPQLKGDLDNRAVSTSPNNYNGVFRIAGLKSNSAIGWPSSDTYSGVIGFRQWSDSSGGNAHEFALNDSGLYMRSGATTSWGSWEKFITSATINSQSVSYATSSGSCTGNAATATKATQDGDGNTITLAYAHRYGIAANQGYPSNSGYGMVISAKPHKYGVTTNNDNYYLLMDSNRRFWIGTQLNAATAPTWTDVITSKNISSQSVNYATSSGTASKLGSSTLGSSTQPIYLSSGTATACSTYAGGTAVTLNGASKAASTASFYAPISAGTAGYTLISSGAAPIWSSNLLRSTTYTSSLGFNGASYHTIAGTYAIAAGYYAYAKSSQFVLGHYNMSDTPAGSTSGTGGMAFMIGNGTSSSARANAFYVTYAGTAWAKSSHTNGSDYAEYFEWTDGNPNNEDRCGYFVTMENDKIKIASENDYILGVVSGNPSVLGNSADDTWQGRFLTDEFDRPLVEEYEFEEEEEINGETVFTTKIGTKYKENPDYDSSIHYIQRADRPEWDAIGMVGVLAVRDDGTCQVNGFCKVTEGGIATASTTGYRVIKRVNDHIIKIIFK